MLVPYFSGEPREIDRCVNEQYRYNIINMPATPFSFNSRRNRCFSSELGTKELVSAVCCLSLKAYVLIATYT
jgi:hypothetical protein